MKLRRVREFFIFTEKEKRGIIILLCLIFLLIAADIFLPLFFGEKNYDFTKWENEIDQYLASQKVEDHPDIKKFVNFNPNETDLAKLVQNGIPSRVAVNWSRYLTKGGRFKRAEDLKKIYGMTPELYDELKMCITIPSEPRKIKKAGNAIDSARKVLFFTERKITQKRVYVPVDLNEADSAALENLPGIGPVLASRIIRFRNILGGFYSVDQMHEVYGLRTENYLSASPYLFIKKEGYRTININFSDLSELGHHPYIGYRTARRILDVRDHKGKFSAADELLCLMGEDSLKKLIPYLVFGP